MIKGPVEDMWMAYANSVWCETYGKGLTADTTLLVVNEAAKKIAKEQVAKSTSLQTEEELARIAIARLGFAVEWLNAGCVTLLTSHKFAAALCASTIRDNSVLDDVKLPATSFRVNFPSGLLKSCDYPYEFTQANFMSVDNEVGSFVLEGRGSISDGDSRFACSPSFCLPFNMRNNRESPLKLLLSDRDIDDMEFIESQAATNQLGVNEIESRRRAHVLAKRLVAGLLLTYSHTTNWSERKIPNWARGKKSNRHGPPPHRDIIIGSPITLDVRESLTNYIDGRSRSKPSIQTLVRGHYRRQACGVGRLERKVLWIEPFWRGPEEAPILVRPHVIHA